MYDIRADWLLYHDIVPWRKKGTEKGLNFSLLCIFSTDHNCVVYVQGTWEGIHESTTSLRFLGLILRVLRLEASTFAFAFLQSAIHKQTWVFLIVWLFCMDFWNTRAGMVFCQVSSFRCISNCCFYREKMYLFKNKV